MMLKLHILSLIAVFLASGIDAWDNDYIKLNMNKLEREYGVNGENKIKFRVFTTKQDCTYRSIKYDEDNQTASLKDESFFDKNLKTKIIAHGNGGCWKTAKFFCDKYAQVAKENDRHYNVIGICWGKGGSNKHAYAGIKLAKVVKSFVEKYGMDVSSAHGIGFSFGGHVISAMATEIKDIGLGQVDRLTLLDPGTHVKDYEVNGKMQQGFIHKEDSSFVDVWHTSTTGIWDEPIGDVDVWVNGGKSQPEGIKDHNAAGWLSHNSHNAAVYMFARTIIQPEGCQYVAAKCKDSFAAYFWKDRKKNDHCKYGKKGHRMDMMGEYINHDNTEVKGNYLLFTTFDYKNCEDWKCKKTC